MTLYLPPRNGRRQHPAPYLNEKVTSDYVALVRRPLPDAYAVLDAAGEVLHITVDSHRAFRVLVSDERAAAKVDAADHARVFATRRKPWSEKSTERAAQRMGAE